VGAAARELDRHDCANPLAASYYCNAIVQVHLDSLSV
jgi:hypothetical protein